MPTNGANKDISFIYAVCQPKARVPFGKRDLKIQNGDGKTQTNIRCPGKLLPWAIGFHHSNDYNTANTASAGRRLKERKDYILMDNILPHVLSNRTTGLEAEITGMDAACFELQTNGVQEPRHVSSLLKDQYTKMMMSIFGSIRTRIMLSVAA